MLGCIMKVHFGCLCLNLIWANCVRSAGYHLILSDGMSYLWEISNFFIFLVKIVVGLSILEICHYKKTLKSSKQIFLWNIFFKESTEYCNLKEICKFCVDLFLCMLFNQGSHGFIKTHRWNRTISAFINIEASGSGGTGIILYLFIMCFVLLKATRVQDQSQILFW